MALLKQSTAYTRMFKMIDSADHFSKKTGLTCTVNISKAGAAFGAAGGTVTEVANGWYKVALTTTDTNTLGDLAYYITATGADDTDFADQVIAVDLADTVRAGLTALPNVASGSAGAIPTTGTGSNQINVSGGRADANVLRWNGTAVPSEHTAGYPIVTVKDGTGTGEIDTASGQVIVATNNDKTGYGLTTLESAALHNGTAQAGAGSTITLAAGASATDGLYIGEVVKVYGGTGAGQARVITAYNGTTKVATVDRAWAVNPASDSTYAILATALAKLDSSLQVVAASVQGNVTGTVASVAGNVAGNVTGNVSGSVGSVGSGGITAASFGAGAIDNAAIATDAIGSAELAASAVTEIQSGLATAAALATAQADLDDIQTRLPAALISGRMDATVGAMQANVMTAAALAADAGVEIAGAVWDEDATGHQTQGSFGQVLGDSGADTDSVWALANTNLNATISSRASQTSVDTIDDFLDTEIAAIKAKTDNLPAAPAAVGDIPTANANADALLKRDMSAVTGEAARSPLNALRFLRNKWEIAAGVLSVMKEDDTTAAWTAALTTDAVADPVTGSDPA